VDTAQKAVITEINYLSQFAIMQEQGEIQSKAENKLEVRLSPNAYFAPDINHLTIYYNLSWKTYLPVNVTIDIYDMGGNLITEIIRDSTVFPGWNTAQWNGRNKSGEIVRNGRYFVVITAESNG